MAGSDVGEIRHYCTGDGAFFGRLFDTYFPRNPAKVWPRSRSPEYYEWKYGPSPFGEPIAYCYWEKGEVVGVFGAMAWNCSIRGTQVKIYEACDSFMAPTFQGKGIYAELCKLVYDDIDRRCKISYAVAPEQLNFDILARKYGLYKAIWFRQVFMPLRFERVCRAKSLGILAPLGYIANLGHKVIFRPQLLDVEEVEDIDAGFFSDPSPEYDFAMVRNKDWLEFRYQRCPEPYRFFLARKGSLDALLVVKLVPWKELTICYLIDVMGNVESGEYYPFLAQALYTVGLQTDSAIISVEVPASESDYSRLKRSGFFFRDREDTFILRQTEWPFLNPTSSAFDRQRWLFFTGIGDNF